MLSWGGGFAAALIGCLILLWIIGKRIDNPAQRHILQSTIPFLYAVAALSANLAFPKENLILFISYGAFYWLAITFMRLPLWLLNLQRTWRYWGASLLLITAFVAILFKDLTYLNALYYYEEHVSLFNLVGIFSKTAIAAALLLYVSYLTPTLGQLATRYWPILRSARLLQGITLSLLGFAALLWIADIVTFGIKLLFGIALAALSVALFNYIRYRSDLLTQKLYPPTIYDTEELIRLRQTLVKALFYTLLFGYCAIAQEWLGFDSIINKLQKVMLIKSEHYRLSLYNLVFAILLFNLLYNYLYLLTKKARRVALWGEAATARSMEAIILNLGILLIFILTALQIGVTWQILLPFAGALGVGIGFGLQTIVNNYLSGFILLFSKKLKIGDIVELDGQAGLAVGNTSPSIVGKIDSIDVLTTNIKTADNIDISIPNSLFLTQKIVNYSHTTPYVRAKIPIGVAYNSNIELVMRLIREALDEAHDVIQTMEKKVILTNYGPSSLDFLALFWIDIQAQHGVLPKGEFMHILWEKFKQHGIEVPFPQQDLWIRNPEALIGKESKSS
ncbi:MAG: mechanosensitive ion channel, partial [Campylobacterales bacterium]